MFALSAGKLMRDDDFFPFFSLIFLDVEGRRWHFGCFGEAAVVIPLLVWSDEITTLFNFLSRVMIRFLFKALAVLFCLFNTLLGRYLKSWEIRDKVAFKKSQMFQKNGGTYRENNSWL
jgi:hypothetical protein